MFISPLQPKVLVTTFALSPTKSSSDLDSTKKIRTGDVFLDLSGSCHLM